MSEQIKPQTQKGRHLKAIIDTQIIGFSRFLVGVPIEHLFDRLKTSSQAQLSQQSVQKMVTSMYRNQGIVNGFFAGFSSSLVIQLVKQYYRWPLMILLPNQIKQGLPKWVNLQLPVLHKILTGIFIGSFESCVICPLERLKIILMTRSHAQSIKSEIRLMGLSGSLVGSMYSGFQMMFTKSVLSWASYLYWDHKARHHFKRDYEQALTASQILICASITGLCNIAIVQPFDTLKTLYQMKDNHAYQQKSMCQAFHYTYQKGRMRGIYSGWQIRLSQFFIQAVLTTPVMDYLERTHGSPLSH